MRWINFALLLGLVACSSQPRNTGSEATDGKMNSPEVEASNPSDETMQEDQAATAQPGEGATTHPIPEVATANPENGTAVAENPPVQRTTVVVNNGRLRPIASFWLSYPSDDKVVSALVDQLQRRPSGQNLKIMEDGKQRRICVDNSEDEKNLFFGFFFSHLSKGFADVHYAESAEPCTNAKVPDFTISSQGAFALTGDKTPNFLCKDEKGEDFHIIESLNDEKKVQTKITRKGEVDNSWHFKKFSINEDGRFHYASGKTVLTLAPLENKDGKISGQLQSSSGTFALSCSIVIYRLEGG